MKSRYHKSKKSKGRNLFKPSILVRKDIKFKTIDGKQFELHEVHQYKANAVKSAKLLREMGNQVRIFEEDRYAAKEFGGFYHGRYGIYVYWG